MVALRYRYTDILKVLNQIILTSDKKDEVNEAMGLQKAMEKFTFIFLVVIDNKILQSTNTISKLLQSKDADLSVAVTLLDTAIAELNQFRSVTKIFEETRIRKAYCHFDELCSDERLTNSESRFRVNVFNGTLDIVIAQLSQRFTSLRQTVNCFKVIEPEILSSSSDNFLFEEATKLVEMYKEDLTTKFPEQILAFRACLKTQILNVKSIRQLADLLIVKN